MRCNVLVLDLPMAINYNGIRDDRENLIMKKRIEFINEWKAAGGLFEEKYYTEGLL